jgi:hypothetical protein
MVDTMYLSTLAFIVVSNVTMDSFVLRTLNQCLIILVA